MNCPVCKRKIEFEIPEEDIYYDCSHCQSSLLFTQGECQIINKEKTASSHLESETTERNLTDLSDSQNESAFEKSADPNEDFALSETESFSSKESPSSESPQKDSFNQEFEKEPDLNEDNQEEEEEMSPLNEKTEVPELKEEFSHSFKENPKVLTSTNFPDETISSPDSQQKQEDFSDVAEFARKQEEDTKGIYLYDLTLSEINSQRLKEEVLAVLEDSYLNLPQEEESLNLKDIIDKGQIKIPRISPIQTYIIVSSLMGLPLNIHWEQHHIADE